MFQYQSVDFTQADLVAFIVVLAVFVRALIKGFHSLPRVVVFPFVLFFFSTALSTAFGIDKVHGVAALLQELEFMGVAWAFSLLTDAKAFLRIIHFILAIFLFESVIAIWQFILGAAMPTGTFVVHQQYAFYTSFAAAMAFALLSNETGPKKRIYTIILAVLLVGSLLGQERATWLSFVVGTSAVVWFSGKNRKRLLIGFGVTVLGAVLLVATVPRLAEMTVARFAEAETDTPRQNSLLSRLILWKVAYDMFTENPVLGIGPKAYQFVVSRHASVAELQGNSRADPHNVWIGTLAEQGIIGFATYVAFCVGVFKLAIVPLRKRSVVGLPRSLCLVYVAYFFFWLTMSYPFFQKGAGHIDFLLIGLMAPLYKNLTSGNRPSRAPALSTAGSY
jgi:O-antigen ligase